MAKKCRTSGHTKRYSVKKSKPKASLKKFKTKQR